MNCKETISNLCDFLDRELEPSLADEIRRHLADCPGCKVVFDTCAKTIQVYCDTEPVDLPKDVEDRLQKVLADRLHGKTS